MKKLIAKIAKYFESTKQYSTRRFIFELTGINILISLIIVAIILILTYFLELLFPTLHISNGQDFKIDEYFITSFVIFGLIIAPLMETLFLQAPILILKRFITLKNSILISATVFALLHLGAGSLITVASAFPSGIIFGWIFWVKSRESFRKGFFITATIHMMHNAFILIAGTFAYLMS